MQNRLPKNIANPYMGFGVRYGGFAITSRFRYRTSRYSRTVTLVPVSVYPIPVLLTASTNHRHCMHCIDLNLAHSSQYNIRGRILMLGMLLMCKYERHRTTPPEKKALEAKEPRPQRTRVWTGRPGDDAIPALPMDHWRGVRARQTGRTRYLALSTSAGRL